VEESATTGIGGHQGADLTLAVRLETEVITGDDRFAEKIAKHPLVKHIRRLQHFVD
jgi:hypothetical protein